MIKKVFLSILILVFFVFPLKAQAQENFSTAYNVLYTITGDANTKARLDIVLTNRTSQYFVSSYNLQVGFDKIENLIASDSEGQIAPKVTKNDTGNAIELKFNKKAVGVNKKLEFTLHFDTPDVAKKQGNILEINIPGIANPDEFSDFNVTVVPPSQFTDPTYSKPVKADGSLSFSKEELGKSGISIAFGEKQVYGYTITYHIKNPNVFPITTEIALPPTTNYQEIILDSLTPKPSDVIIDKDGNWLAKYNLAPSQKIDAVARGRAVLSLNPKPVALSSEDRMRYLQPEKYWEADDPKIRELAKKLKTPEKIYDYVVSTLKYDFNRISGKQERLGALRAYNNPDSAVCLEFTDLFIALSRAAGIPARELNGYAYTENAKQRPLSLVQDILHAWPEYYDDEKKTWVMVDPTWGKTTGGIDYFNVFDFDHFVFVRKGEDSRYPIPAGGYKYEEDKSKKDVSVTFSQLTEPVPAKLAVTAKTASVYTSGLPIGGTFSVVNTGRSASAPQGIILTSSSLSPHEQTITVPTIPPYGSAEISFQFNAIPLLTNNTYDFTMSLSGKETKHAVKVTPFVLTKFRILGGVIFVLSCIIICIIAYEARRIYISRRRK
jgi:transglutaminase-like putative cysteine protease